MQKVYTYKPYGNLDVIVETLLFILIIISNW